MKTLTQCHFQLNGSEIFLLISVILSLLIFAFPFARCEWTLSSVYYSYYVSEKKIEVKKIFAFAFTFEYAFSECEYPFNCSLRQQQHSVRSSLFVSASSCLLFKDACTLSESELESEHFLSSLLPVNMISTLNFQSLRCIYTRVKAKAKEIFL